MPYNLLRLFVEGPSDELFVERVVKPRLSPRYDWIDTFQYAQQKPEKINSHLRSIKAMGAAYFFLADINAFRCFPEKRKALLEKFTQLEAERVVIVVSEIESWYLAGLPADNQWDVQVPADTSGITKEQFNSTLPKGFESHIAYMVEVLKVFDVHAAARKNPSFHYFARRCALLGTTNS